MLALYIVGPLEWPCKEMYIQNSLSTYGIHWLDVIGRLRAEGLTQAEIGEKIGWTESKVKQYSALLNSIVTDVLGLAKKHQTGRVTEKVTNVTFTEGWFRDSGLYALDP